MRITSGYRRPERNRRVGGADGSSHQFGRAVDVAAATAEEQRAIVGYATRAGARKTLGRPTHPRHVHLEW